MELSQLSARLTKYASKRALEHKLGTFLKQNPHLIMNYQMDQLFVESIGSDEIQFGHYSYNTARYNPNHRGGDKYEMYDTGDFFNNMYITIKGRKTVTVTIGSTSSHLEKMLANPYFETHNFFGLTPTNENTLKQYLTNYMAEWVIEGIANG